MKYISPLEITELMVTSSTAAADTEPAWSSVTTYALGAKAVSGGRIYKSLQASNLNHSINDTSWWSDIGASNKMRMFDNESFSQTTATGGLSVQISIPFTSMCDSLALINLEAESVTLDVLVDGAVLHSETINLFTVAISGWYDYFFKKGSFETMASFRFPPGYGYVLRLTINGPEVKVGVCIVGFTNSVGATRLGGSRDLVDYSRASADEYGSWTLTRRTFTSNGSFQCEVPRESAKGVFNGLASVRGTPTLWTGVEGDDFTVLFGIVGKVRVDLATKSTRYFTVEVKGMAA